MFDVIMVIGIGNNSAISTSKILEITAKKRIVMRMVAVRSSFSSNPHSNGNQYSRSSLIFFEINVVSAIIDFDNKMVTVAVVIIIIIYLSFFSQIS